MEHSHAACSNNNSITIGNLCTKWETVFNLFELMSHNFKLWKDGKNWQGYNL
ncbi:MAG: KxYKxGKxW signal peptide domain-containing protein [Chloroflexota bacterium]|nr:MAG: KxYKxGKxW signal peptide domain-containing protein [Chloroflexota bacterium]